MNASDEIVDFLVDQIPTTALAGFQPSSEARGRIWELIAREKDAGLLPEEKLELDDYICRCAPPQFRINRRHQLETEAPPRISRGGAWVSA